jgi:ATP-binding cassette, subfamily B, bacterial PglK
MFTFIKQILNLLSAREKVQLYGLFMIQSCMACVEMAGVASIMPFMAVIATPRVIQSNRWLKQAYDYFQFTDMQSFLFFLGMLVLCLLIFSNMLKTVNTWLTLKYDNHLYYMLSRRLLESYLARPYEFFLNRNTAEMGKNVLAEARNVVAGIIDPCMQVFSSTLITFFILALLLAVNTFIAFAITMVLVGSYALIYLVMSPRLVTIGDEQFEANAMKFKAATEALAGIKDLKILGSEQVFLERFALSAMRHARSNTSAGVISELPRYTLEVIAFGGIMLIVLIKLGTEKTVGDMVPLLALYAFAGYRLLPALQQIYSGISKVRFNLPALAILHQDMREIPSAGTDIFLIKPRDRHSMSFARELVLQDLAFIYPGAQKPAIEGINLSIPPNTSIGVVGATGSGKTTLVDIILGLLKPTSGHLQVDGMEISNENLSCWQLNLGYVPQQIYLYDDTITRNIAFGVPEQEIDMEAVFRAARIANLHGFIEKELPDGFETIIGERGIRLSGGQRQRIGIARALYRDPAVLIMDEATSALDGITEEAVIEALRTLAGEKTVITIAHRLTTVKDCDIIYHMENGRIVNHGTYDELLRSSSWFQAVARTAS